MLEVLEFDVAVFDTPDQRPPAEVVHAEIEKADCVIALLGPDFSAGDSLEPARWPYEEVVYAQGREKPIALIVHPRTPIPHLAENRQTPPRFDFRDPADYAANVHHVVKHLLDTKRRLTLPPGGMPYYFPAAVLRYRVDRSLKVIEEYIYHEVVARQPWSLIHHAIDTGLDQTTDAHIDLLNRDDIEIETMVGAAMYSTRIELLPFSRHSQPYTVVIDPPLPAGGKVGYRRLMLLENFFPLSSTELEKRAAGPGFPQVFRQQSSLMYGQSFDVHSEMETLTVGYVFPSNVRIRSARAVAVVSNSEEVNSQETGRVDCPECLAWTVEQETGETSIELIVRRPLIGHSYVLMYEPY